MPQQLAVYVLPAIHNSTLLTVTITESVVGKVTNSKLVCYRAIRNACVCASAAVCHSKYGKAGG